MTNAMLCFIAAQLMFIIAEVEVLRKRPVWYSNVSASVGAMFLIVCLLNVLASR